MPNLSSSIWNWSFRLWIAVCALGLAIILWHEKKRIPLVAKDDWSVSGGFFKNVEPQRGELPPEVRAEKSFVFWRSWSPETNASVGTLESAPFQTSAPALALPVAGYPAGPGNVIYLENKKTSERMNFRYGNAHETWQELVVVLPGSWRKVPLAVGAASAGNSYVAIGSPSAVGWSTVLKRSLPASIAWHAIVCLLLVSLTALPRRLLARLDPRLGPAARWVFLPLASALIGYAAFFTYSVSPAWTIGLAGTLALAGIVRLRKVIARLFLKPACVLARRPAVVLWLVISLGCWLSLNAQQTISTDFAANYRFMPASWSTDNQLPLIVADGLHQGDPLKARLGGWQVSDRPPAFTGLVALLRTSTARWFAWERHSQLFGWLANLLGILVMSSLVFPVWACLKRANVRGRGRLWIVGAFAFTPFFFFNTVYIWPNLLSGSLALTGWLLLDPRRPGKISIASSSGAGLAFAAALLAHGSIFFSHLGMAVWLAFTQLRRRWVSLLVCGLVFSATLLPWLTWVRKVDPPGNALTKYAFAGTFGMNERDRSVKDTIIQAYRTDTWKNWVQRKTDSLKTWLGTFQPIQGGHLPLPEGMESRRWQFFNLLPALGILLFFIPGIARSANPGRKVRTSSNAHFGMGAWLGIGALSMLIQLALSWDPFVLHASSYGAVVCLHLGLLLAGLRLAPVFRLLITAGVTLNLLVCWLIDPAVSFGHIRAVTFAFALALAAAATVGTCIVAFRCKPPDSSTSSDVQPFHPKRAAIVVWSSWLAVSLAMLWAVMHYGRAFPWMDDISYLPYVTDNAPLTFQQVWRAHNEHRIPLPHLFCWATLKLDGGTFTLARYIYALSLSAAAAFLLRSLRRERGHYLWTDITVPLLLVGFQGIFNVLWFFQAGFVFGTVFAAIILAIIADSRSFLSVPKSIVASLCVIGLLLCGAQGLIVGVLLVAWLLLAGVRGFLSGTKSGIGSGAVYVLGSIGAVVFTIFYFRGLRHLAPAAPVVFGSLFKSATGLIAFGAGYAAKIDWRAAGISAAVVVIAAIGTLVLTSIIRGKLRGQAISLLLFVGAFIALAVAVCVGRDVGPNVYMAVLQDRYALILTPLAIGCYVAFSLCSFRPGLANAAGVGFAVFALITLPFNLAAGCHWGRTFSGLFDSFFRDVRGGVPAWLIAARHQGWDGIDPWSGDLEANMSVLKRKGVLGLHALNDAFPGESYRAVPLVSHFTESYRTTWDPVSGAGEVTGDSPALRFSFDSPQAIVALRMKWKCTDINGKMLSTPLLYSYGDDPLAGPKRDGNVSRWHVYPYVLTKPFESPARGIVLVIPYNTVKYELTDLTALYPAGLTPLGASNP